jgi:bifunctional DNA-binding transcriptional regulator/antitoxin component of YhaV-PrlF toxin-antitoxin module
MHVEQSTVGADGRAAVPATLLAEIGVRAGNTLVLESDGDSLLVRSYEQVLAETQHHVRQLRPAGTGVVDELIAERRAEAARDAGA